MIRGMETRADHPLVTFLKGMAMGTADIIPGVSGGTMAFIMGIYERLLAVIRSVNPDMARAVLQRRWRDAVHPLQLIFAVPLGLGIVCAVIVMTKVIQLPALLYSHPEPVYGLFFGLIAGSIIVLLKDYVQGFSLRDTLEIVAGIVVGWVIVTLTPTHTPDAGWFYFVCGALAISAMLVPGISGSFILLILGKYAAVLDAISRFDLEILLPFAAGCVVGMMLFARIIGYFLSNFHRQTILVISGVLIGTLYAVWPFQERIYASVHGKTVLMSATPHWPEGISSSESLLAIGLMAAGVVVVWALAVGEKRMKRRRVVVG